MAIDERLVDETVAFIVALAEIVETADDAIKELDVTRMRVRQLVGWSWLVVLL